MTKIVDVDISGSAPRERIVKSLSYVAKNPEHGKRGDKFRRVVGDDGAVRWATPDGALLSAIKEKMSGGRFEYIRPFPEPSAALVALVVPAVQDGEVWQISEKKKISWSPKGIDLLVDHGKYIDAVPVVVGHVRPMQQLDLEGEVFFRVRMGDREIVTTAEGLRKQLDRRAMVVAHGLVGDILNHVLLHFAPTAARAHATFGVYEGDRGTLELCTDPMTPLEEQRNAHAGIVLALDCVPDAAGFQGYADICGMVHLYEVLPAMGLGAIAPFALLLRRKDICVPHLDNYSYEHGLGKSRIAGTYSDRLWGHAAIPSDALESAYRLPALFDSTCAPLWIDEGEKIDAKEHAAELKVIAERAIASKRGTPELGMHTYNSRAVLFLTGQIFQFRSGSVVARFIAPRFDASAAAERKARKFQMDALYNALPPLGVAVAKEGLALYPTVEALLVRIRGVDAEITAAYPGVFADPRRGEIYAVVYIGLEFWGRAFERYGVSWTIPDIASFVRDVVVPIEASMWEVVESPLEAFGSWWRMWRVKNTTRRGTRDGTWEEPKGKGELWDEDDVEVGEAVIHGTWITKPILDEYNKAQTAPDLMIPTLLELAKMACATRKMPESKLLDLRGKTPKPRAKRIGRDVHRAAFVPDDDEDSSVAVDEKQTSLELAAKIQTTIATLTGPDDGARRADIVGSLADQGVPSSVVDPVLKHWLEDGTLVSPRPDVYKLSGKGGLG